MVLREVEVPLLVLVEYRAPGVIPVELKKFRMWLG
jgi:hypothetical protein